MIFNYQEAHFLYSTSEEERCEQEIVLQVTQAGLQHAKQKVQYARKRLTKAELRLGRARYMIKKGGFSDVLQQKSCVKCRPAVKVHRTYIPSYFLNLPHPVPSQMTA